MSDQDGDTRPYFTEPLRYMALLVNDGHKILVDAEDVPALAPHRWFVKDYLAPNDIAYPYAFAVIEGRRISMHRFLMTPTDDMVVDHLNGDGLDNRRVNLRVCTQRENMNNRKDNYVRAFANLPKIPRDWDAVLPVEQVGPRKTELSEREAEIFQGIVKGLPLGKIGAALGIRPSTVSTYRARILEKLGATSNVDLVRIADLAD